MTLAIRPLSAHREMLALSDCFAEIWGFADEQVIPKEVFVAAALAGHQVLGAFDGERLVGGSWGFLTWDAGLPGLHSHITGVLPPYRGGGGYALKLAQRDWCLARGIETVTWTFDPMIARNAAFNLRKLGAVGVGFLRDFYGPMQDRFNAGEPTDRMEVRWDLRLPPRPERPAGAVERVAIPGDYLGLRETDPAAARAVRAATADRLEDLFRRGFAAVWFDDAGYALISPALPSA